MAYLLRKVVNREWYQPRRKKSVVVKKDEKGAGELKTTLTSAMEMQSLEFAQLEFGVGFLSCFGDYRWSLLPRRLMQEARWSPRLQNPAWSTQKNIGFSFISVAVCAGFWS